MSKRNENDVIEKIEASLNGSTKKQANAEKLKALQLTLDRLEKTYGKGTIMKLGDSQVEQLEAISTGSLGLDIALGIGGLPKGRIVEIYGPESSGKTTLAIHAIAGNLRFDAAGIEHTRHRFHHGAGQR